MISTCDAKLYRRQSEPTPCLHNFLDRKSTIAIRNLFDSRVIDRRTQLSSVQKVLKQLSTVTRSQPRSLWNCGLSVPLPIFTDRPIRLLLPSCAQLYALSEREVHNLFQGINKPSKPLHFLSASWSSVRAGRYSFLHLYRCQNVQVDVLWRHYWPTTAPFPSFLRPQRHIQGTDSWQHSCVYKTLQGTFTPCIPAALTAHIPLTNSNQRSYFASCVST